MENGSFVGENMTESYTNGSSNNEFDPSQATRFSYRPFLAPIKVFRCKYCGRKFLNSRALGGHQNAHKKERTLWVMGLSSSNHRSLGMVPHALPDHKPVQEINSTTHGKPKESFKRFQDAWRQQISVQPADQDDLRWPGSFQVDSSTDDSIHGDVTGTALKDSVHSPQQSDQSNVRAIDLDLRLGCL